MKKRDWLADYAALRFEKPAEGILEIVLEKSRTLNSVTAQMHTELTQVWREIDADEEISVVLVRGANGKFSSGGDFDLVEAIMKDHDTRLRVWKEARDLVYNIINCSKPVVAAVKGPAVGAGLAVALLSDISIAGRTARFVDGHVRIGVAAGDHAAIIWPLLVGMAKAKYYLLLNESISGEEAERIGLVSQCVDDEKVYETALAVANRLAKGSPSAIRWTKYALNNWLRIAGPIFDTSTALEFLGFLLDDAAKERLFARFKTLAGKKKEVFDADLEALVLGEDASNAGWQLTAFHLSTGAGQGEQPAAAIELRDPTGEAHFGRGNGDGPVHALFAALTEARGMHVDVQSFALHSVSSGEDAQGQGSLSTRHQGEELTASATSTDILEASALAWLALAQRIARRPGTAALAPDATDAAMHVLATDSSADTTEVRA